MINRFIRENNAARFLWAILVLALLGCRSVETGAGGVPTEIREAYRKVAEFEEEIVREHLIEKAPSKVEQEGQTPLGELVLLQGHLDDLIQADFLKHDRRWASFPWELRHDYYEPLIKTYGVTSSLAGEVKGGHNPGYKELRDLVERVKLHHANATALFRQNYLVD